MKKLASWVGIFSQSTIGWYVVALVAISGTFLGSGDYWKADAVFILSVFLTWMRWLIFTRNAPKSHKKMYRVSSGAIALLLISAMTWWMLGKSADAKRLEARLAKLDGLENFEKNMMGGDSFAYIEVLPSLPFAYIEKIGEEPLYNLRANFTVNARYEQPEAGSRVVASVTGVSLGEIPAGKYVGELSSTSLIGAIKSTPVGDVSSSSVYVIAFTFSARNGSWSELECVVNDPDPKNPGDPHWRSATNVYEAESITGSTTKLKRIYQVVPSDFPYADLNRCGVEFAAKS